MEQERENKNQPTNTHPPVCVDAFPTPARTHNKLSSLSLSVYFQARFFYPPTQFLLLLTEPL